jgi:hypothetical protein
MRPMEHLSSGCGCAWGEAPRRRRPRAQASAAARLSASRATSGTRPTLLSEPLGSAERSAWRGESIALAFAARGSTAVGSTRAAGSGASTLRSRVRVASSLRDAAPWRREAADAARDGRRGCRADVSRTGDGRAELACGGSDRPADARGCSRLGSTLRSVAAAGGVVAAVTGTPAGSAAGAVVGAAAATGGLDAGTTGSGSGFGSGFGFGFAVVSSPVSGAGGSARSTA